MRSKGSLRRHLPPPPGPSPAAGEGASIQTAAYPTHRLGIMTSCYRFAVTPHKMRRRHLESVSAAPYGSTFQLPLKSPIRIQPQLSVRGSWGTAPSVFWFLLYAQKERPGGEPYRPSPFGDFVTPLGDYNLSPPGRRTGLAPCKINAPPLGDYNLDLKILLLLFFTEKERPRRVGVPAVTLR